MKDHYDFTKGRKNPYAEKFRKEGYTIMIHYSPEAIAEMDGGEECKPMPDEINAFEAYYAVNDEQLN